MKNLKLELFTAKQKLTMEQYEIANILERFIQRYDEISEKELVKSLSDSLTPYIYDPDAKTICEAVKTEVESKPLVYDLKDLYKQVERQNQGMLYRQALTVILETINANDDEARTERIINELALYDWIPQIKGFLYNFSKNPIEQQNLRNSGKIDSVYTIVEKTKDGFLTFLGDRWFMIDEKEAKQIALDEIVKDDAKKQTLRILEQSLKFGEIEKEQITFRIDEGLSLAISTKSGDLLINGEKADKETTLENVFNSPLVPYLKRDYYVMLAAVKENLNKFVELDIALRVTNIVQPFLEYYALNYKDKMYLYVKDQRVGSSLYEYNSVNELIHDVQKNLDADLTHFYENKLSKELQYLRKLEDKEQSIQKKIEEVNESIDLLKADEKLLESDEQLKNAFDNLLIYKHQLIKNKNLITNQKTASKKKMAV